MTHRPAEISPQIYARIGGVLYLIIIVAGGFAEGFVRSRLIVSGDAAATANNIMASEWMWRLAFVGDLVIYVCGVPLVLIFYLLLSPVNRNLALLAVFFNLVSIAIEGINALSHFAPLLILGGAEFRFASTRSASVAIGKLACEWLWDQPDDLQFCFTS